MNTPALPPVEPLQNLTPQDLVALRSRLADTGYDDAVIASAESVAPGFPDAVRWPLARLALARRGDPAAHLARLFAYGEPLPPSTAREALGPRCYESLTSSGVLSSEGEGEAALVRAAFVLAPFQGVWLLSDPLGAGGDEVMGAARMTSVLAGCIPDAPGAVLDLGCGAGALALVAAKRGATRAVGADLNPRAVALAGFNARLNALDADFVAGDGDEPVRGQRFDLVVSQPPYLLHPEGSASLTYAHGGPRGDEVAVRFVGATPALLTPTGRAVLVFDSALQPSRPLHARLRESLGEAGVELLVLAAPGLPPDLQAVQYASLLHPSLGEDYQRAARGWRSHAEALGVTEFTAALVAVRASNEPGGRFTVTLPVPSITSCDARALDAALASLDLACSEDAAILASTVRAPASARWVEERTAPDPKLAPTRSVRFPTGSPVADRELTDASAALYHALHTSRTVKEAVGRYAALCRATERDVRPQVLAFVRDALARGLLSPAKR